MTESHRSRSPAAAVAVAAAALAACTPPAATVPPPPWVTDTATFQPGAAAALADRADATARPPTKIIDDGARRSRRLRQARAPHGSDRPSALRLGRARSRDRVGRAGDEGRRPRGAHRAGDGAALGARRRGGRAHRADRAAARTCSALGGTRRRRRRAASPRRSSWCTSWDELEQRRPTAIKGAIVLYDVAMPAWTEDKGSGYGDDRRRIARAGASRAAKLGAVARPHALGHRAQPAHAAHRRDAATTPAQPKIPAAAVTVEDARADRAARRAGPGHASSCGSSRRQLPDAPSANVIGELRGREQPDEVVVIGAHLDSWDVGQGAHDDGAGCVTMMQALTVLRKLGLAAAPHDPRRAVHERGERPARRRRPTRRTTPPSSARRCSPSRRTPAASRRAASPSRRKPEVAPRAVARAGARSRRCSRPLGAAPGDGGPRRRRHRPAGAGRRAHGRASTPTAGTYFDYHHTEADTLDKVDPAHARRQRRGDRRPRLRGRRPARPRRCAVGPRARPARRTSSRRCSSARSSSASRSGRSTRSSCSAHRSAPATR